MLLNKIRKWQPLFLSSLLSRHGLKLELFEALFELSVSFLFRKQFCVKAPALLVNRFNSVLPAFKIH